ncbi:MAG: hypothetical protein H0W50_03270 [Parachlamydiaceae bacterium]|nr:hypothetical protein [Parachlamydiaceae bacterium]
MHQQPIPVEIWTLRAKNHADLIAPQADAFLKRRGLGLKHPVLDFLFTYYSCSPLKLKQWVPSFEETLIITPEVRKENSWLTNYWFISDGNTLSVNRERIPANTFGLAAFVEELCSNVLQKPPRFGCYGLHEWAMVYKSSTEAIRHKGFRLRLSPEELASFVESQSICCSHYDAYRFFTEEARPLNILNPLLDTRLQMEQSGCLHANMDLYKWASKLWPWIGSDLIAKAFLLAVEGRELDMRASPYELTDEGYEPILIETEEGRKQYQKEQQLYAERSLPLREELRAFCKRFLTLQKDPLTTSATYI